MASERADSHSPISGPTREKPETTLRANSSSDARVQETLLIILASLSGLAAFVWGTTLLVFGEPVAAALPYGYGAVSFATVALARLTNQLANLIRLQLLMVLITPFLLALVLGGYLGSSAVLVWSFLAPVGAFLTGGRSGARRWLYAYLGLVLALALAHPALRESNHLPVSVSVAFFVLNVGAVSVITFSMLYYVTGQSDLAHRMLQVERDKSERLLAAMLPAPITQRLRDQEQTIADEYESVSVLFADVVGFTPLSVHLGPRRMVELLSEIFTTFDGLAARHGVEKLRTIGDAYMAIAGAPTRRPDHARATADLALDMLAWLEANRGAEYAELAFRIGINSGPLVAGVIGERRYQYDVWGDTVNLASRMESHGVAGRTQIGPTTYELLRYDYDCSPRGSIDVKGRGSVQTWFLNGRLRRGRAALNRDG